MESFINEFITSELEGVGSAEEVLLHRRISPYATLRPGDLATLVKFQQSRLHHPAALRPAPICGSTLPEDSDEDACPEEVSEVVLNAADQGHVPAQYTVKGLRRHEMPVIGVYVDTRVCSGFRYRVRRAGATNTKGNTDYFWGGKARPLLSIGMGYGRRLTFQDDQHNNNECYFWSDSEPAGYAFNIHAVDIGQKFLIQGEDDAVLGEGCVEAIHEPQEETSMTAVEGHVTKHVAVALTCRITYYLKHHYGLMELMAHEDQETITGDAVLVRPRPSAKATLEAIEGVFLPRLGNCKFVPDVC
ncbi:glutamate synthase [NADH], amyloplastic [Elysia marginata]|uniref:Glutamate synthase [NADH], amyloplastic n=1 Tax=Elysia marginata TaxID=1093978 RepID=A0AAV4GF33_9GAST|nr:glutamate synthase [NADH], amyloplastic [Elysia marginata]